MYLFIIKISFILFFFFSTFSDYSLDSQIRAGIESEFQIIWSSLINGLDDPVKKHLHGEVAFSRVQTPSSDQVDEEIVTKKPMTPDDFRVEFIPFK